MVRQTLSCPASLPGASSWFPTCSAWGHTDGRATQEQRCALWASRSQRRDMGVEDEFLLPPACALLAFLWPTNPRGSRMPTALERKQAGRGWAGLSSSLAHCLDPRGRCTPGHSARPPGERPCAGHLQAKQDHCPPASRWSASPEAWVCGGLSPPVAIYLSLSLLSSHPSGSWEPKACPVGVGLAGEGDRSAGATAPSQF